METAYRAYPPGRRSRWATSYERPSVARRKRTLLFFPVSTPRTGNITNPRAGRVIPSLITYQHLPATSFTDIRFSRDGMTEMSTVEMTETEDVRLPPGTRAISRSQGSTCFYLPRFCSLRFGGGAAQVESPRLRSPERYGGIGTERT